MDLLWWAIDQEDTQSLSHQKTICLYHGSRKSRHQILRNGFTSEVTYFMTSARAADNFIAESGRTWRSGVITVELPYDLFEQWLDSGDLFHGIYDDHAMFFRASATIMGEINDFIVGKQS